MEHAQQYLHTLINNLGFIQRNYMQSLDKFELQNHFILLLKKKQNRKQH